MHTPLLQIVEKPIHRPFRKFHVLGGAEEASEDSTFWGPPKETRTDYDAA